MLASVLFFVARAREEALAKHGSRQQHHRSRMSEEGVAKSSSDGMSASSVAAVARGAAARGSQLEAAALSRVVQPRLLV